MRGPDGYGLVAAAGWGLSSVAAAHAARQMGTLAALLISQVTGTIVLGTALAALHPHLPTLASTTVLGLAGAGLFSLLGWLTYYRALEYGPVGIVSGAAATYGGVTAILALSSWGAARQIRRYRDALAVAGVATAAMQTTGSAGRGHDRRDPGAAASGRSTGRLRPGARSRPWGLLLALASALTYGTGAFWLGRLRRVRGVAGLRADRLHHLGHRAPGRADLQAAASARRAERRWAVAAGLAEAVALVAFARGGQAGQVAVTAAVSSTYPVIPLAAGPSCSGSGSARCRSWASASP